ncbi:MAG: DUF4432 family protein [Propionicimonas sp.]|nr:DUF4432 family protein [Propionicimonas sp.]
MSNAAADLVLGSSAVEATVSPRFGGSVTRIRDRATGLDVLWRTPWADTTSAPPQRPLDVLTWCAHSRGGWQVALPNAGDQVTWQGVQHGFHGEASVAAWTVLAANHASVTLALELTTAPLSAERQVTVVGDTVTVRDRLRNCAERPVEFMWTQHPGLGGDLLAGPVTIDTNASAVRLDNRATVGGLAASPGDVGIWPRVGAADLRHPVEGTALLGYLSDFNAVPWVSVTREDGALGVRLTWDAEIYPYCWLWEELGGTSGPPWNSEIRVIGIEPATSWPGQGLATLASTTRAAHRLDPGATVTGSVTLAVGTAARTGATA